MLNAEPSAPSVPNIVIGMTPSPSSVSEIPSSVSSKGEVAAAVQLELPVTPSSPPVAVAAVSQARDTLVAPAMPAPVDSDDEDDEDREPASEQRVRVAEKLEEEKAEAKIEEKVEEKKVEAQAPNLHDTIIDAQKIEIVKPAVEPRHDDTLVDAKAPKIEEPARSEAPKPNFEKTVPFGEPLIKAEPKTEAKVEAKVEEPKPAAKAAPITPEDETVPPAGDLAVAEQFFSEGDVARHAPASSDDLDEEIAKDKAQRKSDPDVVLRRAKFAKYVTWAVGISAALCLVAVVRTVFSSSSKTIAAANAASAPVKSEIVVPKASPPPAVAEAPKPAETAAAAPAETAKPVITGDVKEEKAKVKAALDKNKLADAIEAGERAVAIDETDSEAWLLLGASYHQKGDLKEAQRAYHSCMEKGTKDKFQRECRLFAR